MRPLAVEIISRLILALSILLILFVTPCFGQQSIPAKIVWSKQTGVTRYRLQIANDQQFQDVLFDRLVDGTEYFVSDLPPGSYYWRVAPQSGPTVGQFLKAVPFTVAKGPIATPSPTPRLVVAPTPPKTRPEADNKSRTRVAIPGWSVATGEIVRLMSAKLRPGSTTDFIGVNSEGKVYALDGARGVALWTASFNTTSPSDQRVRSHYNQFGPLLLNNPNKSLSIVVAFDSGVRALEGATGREIWSTKIAGRPVTGTVIGSEIYLVGEKADKLLVLDSATGQLKSQMTLKDEAAGPPVSLTTPQRRQLLIPLKNGLIELRGFDGDYVRSFRLASEVTTQPIVVETERGNVLLLGLKNGLAAFDASTVEPLGRIAIEANDYPVGALSIVDLNGDRLPEVIMTTNAGRVIAIDVADGKIRWSTDAGFGLTPAFADLDADAKPDLVVPGKNKFAVGLSGMTGSVIWESDDEIPVTTTKELDARSVAVATVVDGRLMLVGTDRSAAGLRAFELPKSSAKNP